MNNEPQELPIQVEIKQFISATLLSNSMERIIRIKTNSRFNIKASYLNQLVQYEKISFEDVLSEEAPSSKLKITGGLKFNLSNMLKVILPTTPINSFSPLLELITGGILPELAVNWEKEFRPIIKMLNPRRKSYKDYKKLKKVIIVENYNKLSDKEYSLLGLLINFIQAKKLRDTGLIIQYIDLDENRKEDCYSNIIWKQCDISEDDLQFIDKRESGYGTHVVSLTRHLGIEFFRKYSEAIAKSAQAADADVEMLTQKIIDIMLSTLKDGSLDRSQLDIFLYQCSLFLNTFTKFDIEDAMEPSMFDYIIPAVNTKVLGRKKENTYQFMEEVIKNFFYNRAKETLKSPIIEKIYHYINKNYPQEYFYLAELQQQFNRNTEDTISSYIVAYYYAKKEGLDEQRLQIVLKMKKNEIGTFYASSLEAARKHNEHKPNELSTEMKRFYQETKSSNLNVLAKLCCYSVVVIYYFENESTSSILPELHDEMSKQMGKLKSTNCNDVSYWENEFHINLILLAAAFDEPSDKQKRNSQLFTSKVLKYNEENSRKNYRNFLKLMRVGNTIYMENIEEGLRCTKSAYLLSKEYPYEYELSKINYSFSLIYLGRYNEAVMVLNEKSTFDLNIINKDTYLSYQNNYIVAQRMSGKLTIQKAVKKFEKLLKEAENTDTSDATIIRNNLAAAQLFTDRETALRTLILIKNGTDRYHRFYALHNILYVYFVECNKSDFDQLYTELFSEIKYPNLLKPYEQFFTDKFSNMRSLMERNLNQSEMEKKLEQLLNSYYPEETYAHYKNLILFGGIERWFE